MINEFDITNDGHHLGIADGKVYAVISMFEGDVIALPTSHSMVSASWMRSYADAHGLPVTAEDVLDDLEVTYGEVEN